MRNHNALEDREKRILFLAGYPKSKEWGKGSTRLGSSHYNYKMA